tara:strand:+ start:955 stop:1578 length:624 start_codon:yes stop_codon:yes gene_type:complete
MDHLDSKKKHWENIYDTKKLTEVSWYQPVPESSLNFINSAEVAKDAQIIDIGGGDSFLVDNLISLGYTNLNVLDISLNAIERGKLRLADKADEVTWIESDVTDFKPSRTYDVWHDRAAFHFLTSSEDIQKYLDIMETAISPGGYLILDTFSDSGPKKCSGIEIKQYSIDELKAVVPDSFKFIEGKNIDHPTPSGSLQNFTFCRFQKK